MKTYKELVGSFKTVSTQPIHVTGNIFYSQAGNKLVRDNQRILTKDLTPAEKAVALSHFGISRFSSLDD